MKNIKKSFIVAFIILFLTSIKINAQWVQTNGPYGGDITCVVADSTTIFAGTNGGGVFRSTDNGKSWTAASNGLTNNNITSLALDGTNLFAGTSGGIFMSTKNGDSWVSTSSGLKNQNITSIAVDDTNIFAGTANGLYLSTDNGSNWTSVMLNATVTALACDRVDLLVGVSTNIYKSTDKGKSWTAVDSGLNDNFVNALAVSGKNLFAGVTIPMIVPVGEVGMQQSGGIYRSTNDGESWAAVDSGFPNIPVAALAFNGNNLFSGTYSGVFRSTDNGTTWTKMNSGLKNLRINTFYVKGTTLFAGTGDGVFLSAANDTNWTESGKGIINTSFASLAAFDSNLFAGYIDVQLSINNGITWTEADSGLPRNTYISTFIKSGSNLFAGQKYFSGILHSTNNGGNWTLLDSEMTNFYVTCLAVSGADLFAGDGQFGNGIFRSSDGGISWTAINSGLTDTWVYSLLASKDESGTTNIFAGVQNGGFFRSTDNGERWILQSKDLDNEIVFSLAAIGNNLFAGTNNGVYRSTDNGANWSSIGPTYSYVTNLVTSGTNLFAGATYTSYSNGGIFLTTDNGNNWTAVNNGLISTDIISLAVSETDLFAGTYGSGIWRRPLSQMITGIKPTWSELPDKFSLSQNYPNPFNPSTIINYSIPRSSLVTIKVYDVLGREVSTLVNEQKMPGNYKITFNAGKMASGVYFYLLRASDYTAIKKMLLLK